MEASPPPAAARRDAVAVWRNTGCSTASTMPPTHDPVPAMSAAFRALRDGRTRQIQRFHSRPLSEVVASGACNGAEHVGPVGRRT
eukprot:1483777-Alexandrium_andersonii.AAC.1